MSGWVSQCPACFGDLRVAELECERCGTVIRGHFSPGPWMRLQPDQWDFVLRFLKVRGNLREMERELGVSYPTIRARLEQILRVLGLEEGEVAGTGGSVGEAGSVLQALEAGELSVDEAIQKLENIAKGRGTHA